MSGSPSVGQLFTQRAVVGIGDLAVSNDPAITLSTYALGSCIGIVAFDPTTRTSGMLHLMLPDSTIDPNKAQQQPAVFADTGLDALFKAFEDLKVPASALRIVLAGGASVITDNGVFNIGERNINAVHAILKRKGLSIFKEYLGGYSNRTLHLCKGQLEIKLPNETFQISLS